MSVDPKKLQELVYTLTEDQRRLLREGLAEGGDLDVDKLAEIFNSPENRAAFDEVAAVAPDAGAPDGGVPEGGTHPPTPDPPLNRW